MMGPSPLEAMIRREIGRQGPRLVLATVAAMGVTCGAALLLGLSGWFITAAALAGAAGPAVAHTFNYMMPSALIRLLAIVRTASRYGERVAGHEAALRGLARIRPRLYAGLAARRGAGQALSSGEASARLVEDVDAIQTRFIRLSAPWAMGGGLAVSAAMAGLAHVSAALVLIAGSALVIGGGLWLAERRLVPVAVARQAALGELKARLSELEAAAPELRAWGLEAWAVDQVSARARHADATAVALTVRGGEPMVWMGLVSGLTVAAAVIVPLLVAPAPPPVPMIALAALATAAGLEAATGLVAAIRDAGSARAAAARLDGLVEEAADAPPHTPPTPWLRLSPDTAEMLPPARLHLAGPSGAGKTTLIEQLMGLRPGPMQRLSVGGLDPALPQVEVLGLFAYAAQEPALIDATVADNLRLADPRAPEARLWEVLEDAGLALRFSAAPLGLKTPVGPGGNRLSGGERRRLTLARAYLRAAPWLVLDEPTEGLDARTEAQVLARLDQRLKRTGQGLILVSHRPAGAALCDTVITVSTPFRDRSGYTTALDRNLSSVGLSSD